MKAIFSLQSKTRWECRNLCVAPTNHDFSSLSIFFLFKAYFPFLKNWLFVKTFLLNSTRTVQIVEQNFIKVLWVWVRSPGIFLNTIYYYFASFFLLGEHFTHIHISVLMSNILTHNKPLIFVSTNFSLNCSSRFNS